MTELTRRDLLAGTVATTAAAAAPLPAGAGLVPL
jgi:TAT (twin-arginine translocation) pathway signal sequence